MIAVKIVISTPRYVRLILFFNQKPKTISLDKPIASGQASIN